MPIEISKLTDSDRGRAVVYRGHGFSEWGRIRRWNEQYVFVLYSAKQYDGDQRKERVGETAEATDPRDLEFE